MSVYVYRGVRILHYLSTSIRHAHVVVMQEALAMISILCCVLVATYTISHLHVVAIGYVWRGTCNVGFVLQNGTVFCIQSNKNT